MDSKKLKSPAARRILIEQMATYGRISWLIVSVDGHKISADTDVIRDPSVRPTTGNYSVEFSPYRQGKFYQTTKFRIVCDLLSAKHNHAGQLRCESYADVFGRDDPWIQWMVKMTNLNKHHFDLAARNIGIKIPFSIDVDKLYAWQGDRFSTDSAQFANNFRINAAIAKKHIRNRKLIAGGKCE